MIDNAVNFINQNILLIGGSVVGSIAVVAYIYLKNNDYLGKDEGYEGESLREKVTRDTRERLDNAGEEVNMPFQVGGSHIGHAIESIEIDLSDETPLSTSLNQASPDDEELATVKVFRVDQKKDSAFDKVKQFLGSDKREYGLWAVYEKDLEDSYGVLKAEVKTGAFVQFGGIMMQSGTATQNFAAEVAVRKGMQTYINEIDEYAKRTIYMDKQHSKDMGKYEKEAELEEKRFGGRLNKR